MKQVGLSGRQRRFKQLDKGGDSLIKLNEAIDVEIFRPELETVRNNEHKSNTGESHLM